MRGSTLVLGFGTVDAAATRYLLDCGVAPGDVTVVEVDTEAAQRAVDLGVSTIVGDATHRFVLTPAISGQVRQVIVAVVPDETTVPATMVVRELCASATIVTAVREGRISLWSAASVPTTPWSPPRLIRGGPAPLGPDAARLDVATEDVLVFLRTHTLTET